MYVFTYVMHHTKREVKEIVYVVSLKPCKWSGRHYACTPLHLTGFPTSLTTTNNADFRITKKVPNRALHLCKGVRNLCRELGYGDRNGNQIGLPQETR